MNRVAILSGLMPPEVFVLLLVGTGIALMLGARKIALLLIVTVLAGAFLPPIIDPILDSLPLWLLLVVGVLGGLAILRSVGELLMGKESTDHAVGTLATSGLKAALALPFRVLRWVVRLILPR